MSSAPEPEDSEEPGEPNASDASDASEDPALGALPPASLRASTQFQDAQASRRVGISDGSVCRYTSL